MLDNKYLLELLRAIAESPYQGISNLQLVEKFIGPAASVPDNDPDSAYKFRYHMEEIWRAGLIRNRDTNSESWGLSLSASGSWMIMQMHLVLSPSGGALLE
ncbi:hypothetical protein, partial [Haloferax sp. KTX1]|uniref:hypothetical protein n=1 Tax=Haloferax sp. KTX1 TaxID=2600597 RepID=UPI001C9E3BD9